MISRASVNFNFYPSLSNSIINDFKCKYMNEWIANKILIINQTTNSKSINNFVQIFNSHLWEKLIYQFAILISIQQWIKNFLSVLN